jgi:putative oxidoreductase
MFMLRKLLYTHNDVSLLVVRLVLGVVMLPHGAQKLLGWFGGYGFAGTMDYFGSLGIPALFGLLAIIAEFCGGLALVAGVLTRVAALGIGSVLLGAALVVHLPNGFFMNWFANQPGEGVEYFILAGGLALVLVMCGGGAWSLDRLLTERMLHAYQASSQGPTPVSLQH